MKNIFIAGLQRSGTNYTQSLINKNVDVNVFWGDFNFSEKDNAGILWKHNIQPLSTEIIEKYSIDGIILVIKNPYSWIESIVYRNHIDIIESFNNKFSIIEDLSGKIYRNTIKFNITNLARLYKSFYMNWLNYDSYLIRYEDLLSNKEFQLNKFSKAFGLNVNNRIIDIENVDESSDFKRDRIDKYINEELSHLGSDDIFKINNELGQDFFDIIGYKMKSPN